MSLSLKQKQKITTAFESILRADYISIDQLDQLKYLEEYYIDFYNNTNGVLQKQDSYISGRRGTGKTALLLRGYYECLKTISPKLKNELHIFNNEKVLPIYIDLSTCSEIFNSVNNINLIEIHFIRQVIEALKQQLKVMFDEKIFHIFKQENPALDDLDLIEKILVTGIALSTDKKVSVTRKDKSVEKQSFNGKASLDSVQVGAEGAWSEEQEQAVQYNEIRGLNVQDFLNKINDIRKKAKIDRIYVFIDEFSDLNTEEQKQFSVLLKKLLGSKINMFFKIGVITDRYDFGDKVIIGRDIFPISLDLSEYVEKYNGIIPALKKIQDFISMLIEKRLRIFCPEVKYENIFKIKQDVLYNRLARQALGVPRTIGLILQHAWQQSCGGNDEQIGLQEINYGIRGARKIYFKQFQGSVQKHLVPGFYMEMWNRILEKALSEKTKHPDRPASHLLVDPIRKEYLNVFCENFIIHLLEENRSSKVGGSYNLYSLDYDICMDHNIKYAEAKDEFTAIRFIYDSVLSEFDAYFTKEKLRSYKCNQCGRIYDEKELFQYNVKRCFTDDEKLEEIIHMEVPRTQGNYAEVEIKILGLISTLEEEEAMSAQEIADAVGCSRPKVSNWGSRVLARRGQICIKQKGGKNYYYAAP